MIIKEGFEKYKKPLLVLVAIIAIVAVIFIIVNVTTNRTKIVTQDKLVIHEDITNELNIKLSGKSTITENDLNLRISNESIASIDTKKINNNNLNIVINPKTSGKTSLEIGIGNQTKVLELVVCKKLSQAAVISNKLNLNAGYVIENIFAPSYQEECQEGIIITSNDTSIIEINKKSIKALKEGNATITISKDNNQVNIDAIVSSRSNVPTAIKLDKENITIKTGQIYKVAYELSPSGASSDFLTWTSSNSNIATVSENGIINGINAGNVKITASSKENKNVNKTINVTVVTDPESATIKFNQTEVKISEGESKKLDYSISPKGVKYKSISFTTANKSIVNVKNDGTITGIKQGETYIYANIVKESGRTSQVKVKVNVTKPTYINVKSIDITGSYNLELNKAYSLSYKISPSNALGYKISYTSSNPSVISISSSGKITAHKSGSATIQITATNKDGTVVKASKTVSTVIKGISFERAYAAVEVGSQYKLPLKTNPSTSSIQATYKSGNTNIVTVSNDGTIKGIKTGETTVTATYQGKTATIKVRVVGLATKSNPALLYDLSVYNTVSSWQAMKNHNIHYAILRLGITNSLNSTVTGKDRKFDGYVTGARKNDIELGVYYFSKATSVSAAQNEANFVLKTLNSYPKGTFSLPVFIDYEQEGCPFNATGAKYITAFCDVIEKGGYYCGAYTYYHMFKYEYGSSVKAIWVPDWTCSAKGKDQVKNLGIWQFSAPQSSSCRRPAVYGVDMADNNYMYINYATKIINSGYNNFK